MADNDELNRRLTRLDAMDDQEWAAGCDWFEGSDQLEVLELRAMFVADDEEPLIERMQLDHKWANVVQRLGLLALDEIMKRCVRVREES